MVWNIVVQGFYIWEGVKSLYTNIQNHEGIKVAKEDLNAVPKKPIVIRVIIFCSIDFIDEIRCLWYQIVVRLYVD